MIVGEVKAVRREQAGVILVGVFKGIPLLGTMEFALAIPHSILRVLMAEGGK